MDFTPIQTDRLLIRRLTSEDWPAVHAYTSDPAVMTYILDIGPTAEDARAFVDANTGDEARALAVLLRSEHRLIGHMSFHPWFAPRTREIGWVLHRRYHGQGYATEAARALLAYAFASLRAHRVIATCQPENVASWRVMEKLGMRREALFRQGLSRDETTWWDEYFYAILAEEWLA